MSKRVIESVGGLEKIRVMHKIFREACRLFFT